MDRLVSYRGTCAHCEVATKLAMRCVALDPEAVGDCVVAGRCYALLAGSKRTVQIRIVNSCHAVLHDVSPRSNRRPIGVGPS